MTLHDLAPSVGIACLVLQTIFALVYFFKHRRVRRQLRNVERTNAAVLVDNTGLRAQNARLIQTVAKLRGEMRTAEEMCKNFNPEKE